MSSYNPAWRESLSSQTTDDVADAESHHHAQDLPQTQTHYHGQDYEARRWRDPGWANHRSNVHDGNGYQYDAYPQQQFYHRYRSDCEQQTHSSWNGGQGYGYSSGAVFSSDSVYDTSSDHQPRDSRHGVTSRAQFDKRDVAPVRDPPPRSPSPSYLSISLSPSERDKHPSRKLLILDLNGTLLLRSSPPRFRPPLPRSHSPTAAKNPPQRSVPCVPPPSQPVKRAVYARPYLSSFREYLFHSSTRRWLDVMIWSSAQPHSVQAMLHKCFPIQHKPHSETNEGDASNDNKLDDRFIAVWARDTLGLSKFDYSRKTPTTKDLHKPWRQLHPVSGLDNNVAGESSLPSDTSISEQVIRHSARTTLLLDDSPRKAYLQPWNHVCLKEYDAAARHRDLKALQDTPQKMPMQHIDTRAFDDDLHTAENLSSIAPLRTAESPEPTPLYQHPFDPTLLAIIGILEAVKHESNIAGWIRGNGLWAEGDPDTTKTSTSQDDAESEPAYQLVSGTQPARDDGRDADTLDLLAKSKPIKRPQMHTSPRPDSKESTADSLPLSTNLPNSSSPVNIANAKDSLSQMEINRSSEKRVDHVLQHIGNRDEISSIGTPTYWFSHAPTFAHWVARGRDALAQLGIDERHGVSEEEL